MSAAFGPYREDGTGPVDPWTGHHVAMCANQAARGGHISDTGCLPSCHCPCHAGWASRAAREYRASEAAAWDRKIVAERKRQVAKGFNAEHDAEHGVQHLLHWAIDYSRRGEAVKSSALIAAALELLGAPRG